MLARVAKSHSKIPEVVELDRFCQVNDSPYSATKAYLEDDLINSNLYAVHANSTKTNLEKVMATDHYARCIYM